MDSGAGGVSGSPAEPSRPRRASSRGTAALSLPRLSHSPATCVGSHLGPCPAAVSAVSSGTHPTQLSTLRARRSSKAWGNSTEGFLLGVKAWVEERGMLRLEVG